MTYDPNKKREYYLKNRDRIRAYQAEYRSGDEWNAIRRIKDKLAKKV
jgi:hypothetical protein